MALHTNVGLGDFVLMDDISMEPFLQNLKKRSVFFIFNFLIVAVLLILAFY
jgi:hypothetical protein